MPNIWTHLLFGQEALAEAGLAEWIEDENRKRLFNMGCQGPDFLFYHQFFPWQRITVMNEIGAAMHNEHCGPFLLDLLSSVPTRQPENRVYALGFLLHHILDRHMHPYVFVRSGFRKWDHQRFEVLMDTHIVRRKTSMETWKTPVWKEINTGGQFPQEIVRLFMELTDKYYPELAHKAKPEYWNDANRDMLRAQRLFHDPYGLKTALTFRQIEPFVYKRNIPPYDVLNETRTAWPDPTGTDETYTTSIWDMWETAREDAACVLAAAIDYWKVRDNAQAANGPDAEQDIEHAYVTLQEAIANRSYETGLELEHNRPITVEDPIWSIG
ncbi:zinc dependent phospholipase C family protein [Paenibacillus apiarius]|uniref:Zinc dependent phospholipase C family protein n=1 Tax=Paenibacillus apiarius TaxID=46240 RepID=A0ABT4DYF6_9BACL|nr:zinc dependent phospholipase C family protein [Paenibacillus apiarius]MCY9512612.1 zinc dependent phospholipase C family protein [Paenibacillus apiarius]MCY9522369.1 zinc dependent phospholipase C family protein [Paenibacillus apiarius]MCY9553667.1 zinc dependent phospholipase C family protein [Paenibacillus apiarius]MCY9556610.1 zinc dependent phospholipase C family protein [Paenibacillus apiarius]MCY9682853.1 zinc dependent phospholipase C family protein [Paenibacillus apiarius]